MLTVGASYLKDTFFIMQQIPYNSERLFASRIFALSNHPFIHKKYKMKKYIILSEKPRNHHNIYKILFQYTKIRWKKKIKRAEQ